MGYLKETFTCDLIEKEILSVTLYQVDLMTKMMLGCLHDVNLSNLQNNDILTYNTITEEWTNKEWSDIAIETEFVYNEIPTLLFGETKKFQTTYIYKPGTLQVLLNGIKEKNITEHAGYQTFSLPIDFDIDDDIEISYIKD